MTDQLKILIVVHQTIFREALARSLRDNYAATELLQAGSLAEADAVLSENKDIGLILLDPQVSKSTCNAAVDHILERTSPRQTIVVLVSDEEMVDLSVKFEQGISYLPKSVSIEVLLAAVMMALAGNVFLPVCAQSRNCHPYQMPLKEKSSPGIDLVASTTAFTSEQIHTASSAGLCSLGLTVRQTEVLYEMLQGKPIKLIARALDMSVNTAKTHIGAILRALHVTNRTQAVIAANQIGLNVNTPELTRELKRAGLFGTGATQ